MSQSLARQIEHFLTYIRDVRQLSPHTLSNYGRDLKRLQDFCQERGSPRTKRRSH